MTECKPQRVSIKSSFMYKHGFSLVLGLLAALIVIVTANIMMKQKTHDLLDLRKDTQDLSISELRSQIQEAQARIDDLSKRVRVIEQQHKK